MEAGYTTFILLLAPQRNSDTLKWEKKMWMYSNFFAVGEINLQVIVLPLSSGGTAHCYVVRSWDSSSVLPATTITVFLCVS